MPLTETDCAASYKILILGDASVGKTAILRCLIGKDFQERLHPTIATDFIRTKFEVDGALVELQIWDTAGQERFHSVTRWQYRGVKGVAMVYDVTDSSTFSHLSYWMHSVNQEIAHQHNKYEAVPIVLLGNKSDLGDNRQVTTTQGQGLADKELAFGFYETSARTGQNVFTAFRTLAHFVTEICNPDVMKSFHRNMIREPKFAEVFRYGQSQDIVVKANMKTNHVTIQIKTGGKEKSVKLKEKKHKKKIKCCL